MSEKHKMSLTSILLWICLLPFESLAQVRLSGGSETAGRVEVFLDGEWGTVCDDNWDIMDATVVCRQLGFPAVLDALERVDEGQGPIHLDEVACIGDESSLLACRSNFVHHCSHSEDVGIACSEPVRLSGGSKTAGRVEVFLNGEWGTVCGDNWDVMDAEVVCRQLDFPAVLDALKRFDEGQGPIHFSEVACIGDESSLLACPRSNDSHYCFHSEDVGVECSPVRLAGGNEGAGRVEVFLNGQWGTVCDDNWDVKDATVVCRQLGFPAVLDALKRFDGGQGIIHLDEVACIGDESSLLTCPRSNTPTNCLHSEDVGIACLPVRLSGGSETAGRVEVFLNGEWGTVCDDNWDFMDASVVCRQLGFAAVLDFLMRFDEGQGIIHLDEVACIGNESSLLSCPRSNNRHNCLHIEDVGVECSPVRLSGGSETAGRVEVFLNGEWGTVCDDGWDVRDATVVCRQLGFPAALEVFARVDGGQGIIHLDDVTCNGDETSLLDCPRRSILHDCTHEEDVGIACLPVRLSGGSETAGRVEVFLNGEWGTVCDDNWDVVDATVVCRQLGFPAVLNALIRFPGGRGIIHLDEVTCNGDEISVLACPRPNFPHDCSHREDVGVTCSQVRLADGNTTAGRIEIYLNGHWGTVCDDSWDLLDATVVCRQLGFKRANVLSSTGTFGGGLGPIHINDVECHGHEQSLLSCEFTFRHNCDHRNDVGVNCLPFDNYAVRLAGNHQLAGRVEVYINGLWGTVCDDFWDLSDAQVVCRQLGFKTARQAIHGAWFGEGTGPVYLDDVGCVGDETSLFDCMFSSHPNCQHNEDAGVICVPNGDSSTPRTSAKTSSLDLITQATRACSPIGKVRLSGGNETAGRVEICLNEKWGTVCDDDWGLQDAEVVCRELGYKKASAAFSDAFFGEGSGYIHLDETKCLGNETTLLSCNHSRVSNCQHKEDASVTCIPFVKGEIRLAGGNKSAGRVEVYLDDQWGTVCDDEWDKDDANVVCRSIGFMGAFSAPKTAAFGEGEGPIHLDSVKCTGDEHSLLACEYKRLPDCQHHEDASVVCQSTQEISRTSRMPLILSMCIFAVIIGAVVMTIAYFYLRREQKLGLLSRKDNNSSVSRPLPDAPITLTSDNVVETVVLESGIKPEKDSKATNLARMSKGDRISYSNNTYMAVTELGDNDMVNYERMNPVKDFECNVTPP